MKVYRIMRVNLLSLVEMHGFNPCHPPTLTNLLMISCIIVDDEPHAVDILSEYASEVEDLRVESTFTKPLQALAYLEDNPVDLVFLDINMPKISGLQFARQLRGKSKIVFVTAYAQYGAQSFGVENVVHYLVKPVGLSEFLSAVQRARRQMALERAAGGQNNNREGPGADFILVPLGGGKYRQIKKDEIDFISGMENYVVFHTAGDDATQQVISRYTLKEVETKLTINGFIRVHKSYIVPLNKVDQIQGNMIQIAGSQVPLGAAYRDAFMESFKRRIL